MAHGNTKTARFQLTIIFRYDKKKYFHTQINVNKQNLKKL